MILRVLHSSAHLPRTFPAALAQGGAVLIFVSLLGCSDGDGTNDEGTETGGESGAAGGSPAGGAVGAGGGDGAGGAGSPQESGGAEAAGGEPAAGGTQTTGGQDGMGTGGNVAVVCAGMTCAEGEYCRADCSGTGGPLGDPSCTPLPLGCENDASCDCVCGGFTSFCSPGAEAIQCGCP